MSKNDILLAKCCDNAVCGQLYTADKVGAGNGNMENVSKKKRGGSTAIFGL